MSGTTFDELSVRPKEGRRTLVTRYRWFTQAPIRDPVATKAGAADALNVYWIGVTISDASGKTTYDGAFVTSLPVTRDTVAEIAACARARWKIENESFNVLKNNGYHLEHNFGHGKDNLAMMLAAMNLLAFAFHTVWDCIEALWNEARRGVRRRQRLSPAALAPHPARRRHRRFIAQFGHASIDRAARHACNPRDCGHAAMACRKRFGGREAPTDSFVQQWIKRFKSRPDAAIVNHDSDSGRPDSIEESPPAKNAGTPIQLFINGP